MRRFVSPVLLFLLVCMAGVLAPWMVPVTSAVSTGAQPLSEPASPLAVPTQTQTITVSVDDSAVVELDRPADHVAVYWQGSPDAQVTLAFSTDGANFGRVLQAGRDDAEGERLSNETFGEVLAAYGATAVRVTTDTPLAQLSVIAMSPGESFAPAVPGSLTAASEPGGSPTIISRTGWGANPAYLNWAPRFYPAKKVIIHHTADGAVVDGSQESYAKLLRSIYYYHAVTRDWGDVAYNYIIDPLGNIYEGRFSDNDGNTPSGVDAFGNGVTGGHTYNYNTATVGIAVLGTYASKDISPAARASLETLLAWVSKTHGIDPLGSGPYYTPFNTTSKLQTWNITGHRDYGSTDCPGQAFYDTLPAVRQNVFALTGPVAEPTPSPTYLRMDISPAAPSMGQKVALTATLMEESTRKPVSGQTISFGTGGIATSQTSVGTAKTDSSGVATLQMSFGAAGMRWITALYSPGSGSAYRGATTSAGFDVAPSGLTAGAGNTKVQLSWTAAPGASGYNVYRNSAKVNSSPITAASYLDSGLTNGSIYTYQVTAVVNGRESAKSAVVAATPGAVDFTDVSFSHPYYAAIQSLAIAGIINGKTDGRFYPGEPVTRQQFAKMIVLGCGYPVSESDVCPFKDVTKSGTSSLYPDNYVAVCAARGITVGKTATSFDPHSNITRAQVLTMVVRAADDSKPFVIQDPPAGWKGVLNASDKTHGVNIAKAEYNELLAGIDLAAFTPTGKATRGEIAQIIFNLRAK